MPGSPLFRGQSRKAIALCEEPADSAKANPAAKHTATLSSTSMSNLERRRLLPSMPEEDPDDETSWKYWLPTGRAFTLPVVALHIALGTAIWQQLMAPGSSIGDAFYFAVETFLTIGYDNSNAQDREWHAGDITPASNIAKAFFILFTVLSLVVQLTVVTTFVSSTLSMNPQHNFELASAPGGDIVYPSRFTRQRAMQERLKAYFKVRPRIIKAAQGFVLLVGLVTTGAVMLRLTSANEVKNLSWLDCWYWSVTTISTVGYGDIAPTRYRPLFACFFIVAVVLFAFLLAESIALVTELGNYRRLAALFENGLSREALEKMDNYQSDGQVSREEFLMFILQHLNMVDRSEMEQILTLFESCDSNGDGHLDLRDIKYKMSRASRVASRSGAVSESQFSRAAARAVAATSSQQEP